MAALLEAVDLSKRFLKDEKYLIALEDFSLKVDEGDFVVILGRSGCGKSTFLNIAAGLMVPSSGHVLYRGNRNVGPTLQVGYLTQSDSLMPWRNVRRNIEMPLEMESKSKKDRAERARELIARVGLEGFENHYPRELSGGMRRRASLARMLISDPETLLLDEPFGALDAQLREDLQQQLLKLWQGSGRTVIFVTHDIEEAVLLADRVVVLGARGSTVLDKRVDIPRPRDLENVRSMPIFSEYRSALTSALKPVDKVDIFSDTRGAAT